MLRRLHSEETSLPEDFSDLPNAMVKQWQDLEKQFFIYHTHYTLEHTPPTFLLAFYPLLRLL